ncbi:cytochrome c oxidase assembly protein [Bacillus sp. FJAT-49736]|uniref:cytochrome c oxidase assembly protein n=1 Tax=Bacillus sp. FJAT-49736 TaxID=2833582 RepID=UPI001BC945A8|nr:cytochrome c oxidase assembly protein [Bacillus sp. FJAT-49736]MBS4173753.1 cytochrome c oxidase assembly protein [Bacillus sp. FJAT-49736]
MLFSIFKDRFTWSLMLFAFMIICSLVYWYFIKVKKNRMDHKAQPFLFFSGLSLLYLLKGSPLTILSHFSYTTHMLQMSIIYFYIPPLILLGIPKSIINKLYYRYIGILSLSLFGLGLFLYHLPTTAIYIMSHTILHEVYLWIMFISAIFMWYPLSFQNKRNNYFLYTKMKYTSLQAIIITPACLLLIVLPLNPEMNPLFTQMSALCISPSYMEQLLPFPFNTSFDQQFAGFLMFLMHKASVSVTSKIAAKSHGL